LAAKKKRSTKQNRSKKTIPPKPKLTYSLSSKKPEQQKRISYPVAAIISTEQEANAYHQGMYSKFTPIQPNHHIVVQNNTGVASQDINITLAVDTQTYGLVIEQAP
jgi:hypothetical protein